MKKIIASVLLTISLTSFAKEPQGNTFVIQDESQLDEHGSYTNVDGKQVHKPAHDKQGIPSGATAKCVDGTYSFSLHHRGTCSHHGGVGEWLN